MSDHLTKVINPRGRWRIFFDFMKMVKSLNEVVTTMEKDDAVTDDFSLKRELAKVAVAGCGAPALATLNPEVGSDEGFVVEKFEGVYPRKG